MVRRSGTVARNRGRGTRGAGKSKLRSRTSFKNVRSDYWIQGAVKKPGTLRQSMRSKYGSKAFTERGTIKPEYLSRASREGGKLGQRARLARTLRTLRK